MKKILLTLIFSCFSLIVLQSQPTLIKGDINADITTTLSSDPSNLLNFAGKTYFTATGSAGNVGLYVTDGTPEGTKLVKHLNANVTNLIATNNLFFFIYEGSSLFMSDGTYEGTKPLAKFRSISKIINCNGIIYFTADDQIHGMELWKTDGTTKGTQLVKDVAYGLLSSNITNFKVLNNKLFFLADDGINGLEPWLSDGTESGTKLIKNIHQAKGITDFNIDDNLIFKIKDYLIFPCNDGEHGTEFWSTDGTPEGTQMIKDIKEGNGNGILSYNTRFLGELNNNAYFYVQDENNNISFFKSDGTTKNTIKIKDLVNSVVIGLAYKAGDKFILRIQENGKLGLWVIKGTTETVTLLNLANIELTNFSEFGAVCKNKLFFGCITSSRNGIAVTDGTEAGTVLIKDGFWQAPMGFSALKNYAYCYCSIDGMTRNIFKLNETECSTLSGPEISSSFFNIFYNSDTTKIFANSSTYQSGSELFSLTENQFQLLKDINTGKGSLSRFLSFNNKWIFSGNYMDSKDLWSTDGTPAGTTKIKTFDQVIVNPFVRQNNLMISEKGKFLWNYDESSFAQVAPLNKDYVALAYAPFTLNNKTFFWKRDTGACALWKTDGTNDGTKLVKTFIKEDKNNWIGSVGKTLIYNNKAYFAVANSQKWNSVNIYSFDGTTEDTTMLLNTYYGSGSLFYDPEFTLFNDKIYFQGDGSLHVIENETVKNVLWCGNIAKLVAGKDHLFFVGSSEVNGSEIWKSDGTTEGTKIIKDINPGKLDGVPILFYESYPKTIFYNNYAYFWANDGSHGNELWKTNGTLDGTKLVKDINPGLSSSNPNYFYIQNNKLFFTATDEMHGREVWCTEGTENGTYIAGEVNVGPLSSIINPNSFEYNSEYESQKLFFGKDDDLYFPAMDPTKGQQLWKLSISSLKNNAPQSIGDLKDTSLVVGSSLQYKVPVFTFDDPNDYLTYVATLKDGSPLPDWLKFNQDTRTFTGTPASTQIVDVKITAYDRGNLSVSNEFTISVSDKTSNIKDLEYYGIKVYPNPATNYITVELENEHKIKPAVINLSDLTGKDLINVQTFEQTIDIKIQHLQSGIYIIKIKNGETTKSALITVQ